MKEYDVYLPLKYNDDTPVDDELFAELQKDLVSKFGGLTFFPQPNQGFWTQASVTDREEIVVYRILADDSTSPREYFKKLKDRLKADFAQDEILIIERNVEAL